MREGLGTAWGQRFAAVLCCLASALAMGAGPPAGADEVIRLAIKAQGGQRALAKELPIYARFKKVLAGECVPQTIHAEQWIDGAKRMRLTEQVVESEISRAGIVQRRYARTVIYEGGKERRVPAERSGAAESMFGSYYAKMNARLNTLETLAPLAASPALYSARIEREERIGTRSAVTLRIKSKDMPDVLLSFDRATWLLLQSEVRLPFLLFQAVRVKRSFSDYKPFEGTQVARKIVQVIGEKNGLIGESKCEIDYLEYRLLERIDDSLFK